MTAEGATPAHDGTQARIDEPAPDFEARSTQGLVRLVASSRPLGQRLCGQTETNR